MWVTHWPVNCPVILLSISKDIQKISDVTETDFTKIYLCLLGQMAVGRCVTHPDWVKITVPSVPSVCAEQDSAHINAMGLGLKWQTVPPPPDDWPFLKLFILYFHFWTQKYILETMQHLKWSVYFLASSVFTIASICTTVLFLVWLVRNPKHACKEQKCLITSISPVSFILPRIWHGTRKVLAVVEVLDMKY